MTDRLAVTDLEVTRTPGFEHEGFAIRDLSPGVTVIHGPNGAGKTTIAKTIGRVLWPDSAPDDVVVTGRLSNGETEWRVDLTAGRVTYQADGQESPGPTIAPVEHRDRYVLSLHDLLQDSTQNESFARRIHRESVGGYDLAAAADQLGFDGSVATAGKGVVKRTERAQEDVQERRRTQRDLKRESQRLETLRSQLAAAESARERVDCLDAAIDCATVAEELDAANTALEAFPDALATVTGDEMDRVAELETEIEDARRRRARTERDLEGAQRTLASSPIPEDGVPDALMTTLTERRDTLAALERDRRDADRDLDAARRRRDTARSEIPFEVTDERLGSLDPADWGDVTAFVRAIDELETERRTKQAVDRWLDEGVAPDIGRDTLERASTALENWLASSSQPGDQSTAADEAAADEGSTANDAVTGTTTSADTYRVAIAAAVVIGLAGVTLGVLVHPLLFLVTFIGAGFGWYGRSVRLRARDADRAGGVEAAARTHRQTFERLELESPADWSPGAVRERLFEIYAEIAAHELDAARSQLHRTLLDEHDSLADTEASVTTQQRTLAAHFGAEPAADPLELHVAAAAIERWQAANADVVDATARLDRIDREINSIQANIGALVAQFDYEEPADAETATGIVRELDARIDTFEVADREREAAEAAIERETEELESLEQQRDAIYTTLDLDVGDRAGLERRCRRVDEYRAQVAAVKEARTLHDDARRALEAHPLYDPTLFEREVADLRAERQEVADRAADYDEIHREITAIETRIEDAKQERELESAIATRDRALAALDEQLESDYAAVVGGTLVDHVRAATTETSRPAVFDRAASLFATITAGRYRLELDDDGNAFRAFDTVAERGRALEELSSGTRIQLLMAVRIAFVERLERGRALPLVLDETLANSDDRRANVIIESLIALAREGRQIWYFTAQGDEVAKWRAALANADDVDYCVRDLATVSDVSADSDLAADSDLDPSTSPSGFDAGAFTAPSPPAPAGHDHTTYGAALGVDGFDPASGAADTHLWYLVDDIDLLATLLEVGLIRWGQLATYLDRGDGMVIDADEAALDRIRRRGVALEELVRSWQQGRGSPVTREALRDSGAVSDTFMDEVTALAEEVGRDAERVIESLRSGAVDRFRSAKAAALASYFESNGYIVSASQLTPTQIRIRVIQQFRKTGLDPSAARAEADALFDRLDVTLPVAVDTDAAASGEGTVNADAEAGVASDVNVGADSVAGAADGQVSDAGGADLRDPTDE